MHEAQMHAQNCFLTLTYNDQNLPDDYSIDVEVHKLFMKRLRASVAHKIRFFAAGEYGDLDNRPHYHYLIFNYRPTDLKLHSTKNNINLYTSEKISKLWPYGFSTVGNLTYKTAAYTARYVIKKQSGDIAPDYYTRVHPLSGNLVRVKPEFAVQSLRPGIGDAWFNTFKSDIYPSDFCVVDGKRHMVPKFYVKKLAAEELKKIKLRRKLQSNKKRADNTPARLKVREDVQLSKTKLLKRSI